MQRNANTWGSGGLQGRRVGLAGYPGHPRPRHPRHPRPRAGLRTGVGGWCFEEYHHGGIVVVLLMLGLLLQTTACIVQTTLTELFGISAATRHTQSTNLSDVVLVMSSRAFRRKIVEDRIQSTKENNIRRVLDTKHFAKQPVGPTRPGSYSTDDFGMVARYCSTKSGGYLCHLPIAAKACNPGGRLHVPSRHAMHAFVSRRWHRPPL